MNKKIFKKALALIATPLFASGSIIGLSANAQVVNSEASAYFDKTVIENGKTYNLVNVSFKLNDSEVSDLKSYYAFISFTLEHQNLREGDNVMYLGYQDKIEELTSSFIASRVSLQNGKFDESSKTYTLTVKFSGLYAWELSTFKFQLGLSGRTLSIKPTAKPIEQTRVAVKTKAGTHATRTNKDLSSMSDAEILKLAQSVETYKPAVKKQWKPAISEPAFIGLDQNKVGTRSAVPINISTGKPFVTLQATKEYLEILPDSQKLGLVPNLSLYQVVIPNTHKFSENSGRRFYLNMTIQQDGQRTGNVSYVVDGNKAELIGNLGSNKSDLSMYTSTYKANDNDGYITFQLLLGKRWDPSKTRIVMSFTGYRNGSYFEVAGKNRKVGEIKLTKWQQNEVWRRGTWNKYVSLNNALDSNLDGKEVTLELSHPDTPKTILKYKVKGEKLVPVGNNSNGVKFNIHRISDIKQGQRLGFYVELSSLFDPTKAIIKVTFDGKTQEVKMPNFWGMFDN